MKITFWTATFLFIKACLKLYFHRTVAQFICFPIKSISMAVFGLISDLPQIILEGIMDGQKMKDIAKEIGVSRTRAQELKNKVVNDLAWAIYDEEKKKEKALSW
ncbi:hypothetical protein P9597_01870 [Aneurinibacillus migulanus]|uniref:hypothetical protein n=1 Tax=Aneurinibacillus migulanus TaxID=47500 RepID=UPI002E1C4138|nr:hypothetical protein [Aneurinibacillus migulanus]